MRAHTNIPALMPQLSVGSHRNARRGACFMEFASYLAGERWSDHPECTDPVLAALARGVNDGLSDARRGELVHHIPRVIGLRGDDSVVGLIVALRAGVAALPVASMERQRSLALGIQGVRRVLASRGAQVAELEALAEQALCEVPDARRWAEGYLATQRPGVGPLHASATQAIAGIAAAGIAQACIDDPDSLLIETLQRAINDVEALLSVRTSEAPAGERALVTA
ncbi:hypothetical protein BH09ACT4_BH09ACT4_14060 [soil metagenome]